MVMGMARLWEQQRARGQPLGVRQESGRGRHLDILWSAEVSLGKAVPETSPLASAIPPVLPNGAWLGSRKGVKDSPGEKVQESLGWEGRGGHMRVGARRGWFLLLVPQAWRLRRMECQCSSLPAGGQEGRLCLMWWQNTGLWVLSSTSCPSVASLSLWRSSVPPTMAPSSTIRVCSPGTEGPQPSTGKMAKTPPSACIIVLP